MNQLLLLLPGDRLGKLHKIALRGGGSVHDLVLQLIDRAIIDEAALPETDAEMRKRLGAAPWMNTEEADRQIAGGNPTWRKDNAK